MAETPIDSRAGQHQFLWLCTHSASAAQPADTERPTCTSPHGHHTPHSYEWVTEYHRTQTTDHTQLQCIATANITRTPTHRQRPEIRPDTSDRHKTRPLALVHTRRRMWKWQDVGARHDARVTAPPLQHNAQRTRRRLVCRLWLCLRYGIERSRRTAQIVRASAGAECLSVCRRVRRLRKPQLRTPQQRATIKYHVQCVHV